MQKTLGIEDGSNDKRYFTIIPNYVLNHSTMWDREVYVQMKRIAGEQGTCWTSRKTLAKQCGMSPRRLDKSIEYLVEHKWIKQVGTKNVNTAGGNQKVNEYKITDLWDLNNKYYQDKGIAPETTPCDKGIAQTEQRYSTDEVKGIAPGATKEEPIIKNITNKEEQLDNSFKNINYLLGLFKDVNPSYKQLFMNRTQRMAITRVLKSIGEEKLKFVLNALPQSNAEKYAPTITTPLQLEEKLGQLIAFYQKKKNNKNQIAIL